MGIELSNDRLSVGIGSLDGAMRYVDRVPIRHRLEQEEFEHLFRTCLATLGQWTDWRTEGIRQAAIAIPGYSPFGANPLFQWDMDRLRDFLRIELDGIPVAVTNSVIAQASLQRYGNANYPVDTDHLFLFVGHGVAGAVVNETIAVDAFSPFEIGHMVLERDGRPCRCGHHGCLEAYTSLTAIAEVLGVSEAELLRHGDRFVDQINPCESMRADLRDRLYLLGLAVGNALNLQPVDAVVISGWPSLLEAADTTSIAQGIDGSLLGGNASDRIRLDFVKPAIGSDPQAAHSYARYCLVRGGAVGPAQHHELPARAAS
jgi:predicted NBD/HSP70 family sugar kinase